MCLSSDFKPQSTENTPFKAGLDVSVAATDNNTEEIIFSLTDNYVSSVYINQNSLQIGCWDKGYSVKFDWNTLNSDVYRSML